MCLFCYAVTCVDSGDKALKYLGLVDDLDNTPSSSSESLSSPPQPLQQEVNFYLLLLPPPPPPPPQSLQDKRACYLLHLSQAISCSCRLVCWNFYRISKSLLLKEVYKEEI